MTKKGRELEFISRINRDGSGTTPVDDSFIDFVQEDDFDIIRLSMTEDTWIATYVNAYVVRLKKTTMSNKIDPNEPALPITEESTKGISVSPGLTIRAEFAARAMQGMMANPYIMGSKGFDTNKAISACLYVADTLIAELDKPAGSLAEDEVVGDAD